MDELKRVIWSAAFALVLVLLYRIVRRVHSMILHKSCDYIYASELQRCHRDQEEKALTGKVASGLFFAAFFAAFLLQTVMNGIIRYGGG